MFSTQNQKCLDTIETYLNNQEHKKALEIINDKLSDILDFKNTEDVLMLFSLAGKLIDLGSESWDKVPIIEGLKIIETNTNLFNNIVWQVSIDYCIGNAKISLFDIDTTIFYIKESKVIKVRDYLKYKLEKIDLLREAKKHYWKAYNQSMKEKTSIDFQIITNLANTLSTCGRVIEALQYYDKVLSKSPNFPQANGARAEELIWLNNLSKSGSVNLLYQAKTNYVIASESSDSSVSKQQKDDWKNSSINLSSQIADLGYNDESIKKIIEQEKKRFKHSDYRVWCLKEKLTLSEHSIYCSCIGARYDDLKISLNQTVSDLPFIPLMEKYLNRFKSEFSLARQLLYNSIETNYSNLNANDNEIKYTELNDNEVLSTNSELLRTCFRMCLGILDKIAGGICKLYDLEEKDNIYFERFWKPNKNSNRWKKLNEINNISLVALYCQATDLNSDGELSFFKEWRNHLEHNLLILVKDGANNIDQFQSDKNILHVNYDEFKEKTLHLLQFTRSAIFNFTFMVRNEAYYLINQTPNDLKV